MLISPTMQELAEAVTDNIATRGAFAIIVFEQLTSQLLLVLRAIVFLLFLSFFLFLFAAL